MRQMITDRRVWTYTSGLGMLLIHDHVDDSRVTATTRRALEHFYLYWATEFGEPVMPKSLNEDFTGLRHHVLPGGGVEISCRGVLNNLELALRPFPLRKGTPCDTPMATSTLRTLLLERGVAALVPELVPDAQSLIGIISFVVMHVRPDSYFSCNMLAAFVNERSLTQRAFDAIVRLGWYLIESRHLHLVIHPPRRPQDGLLRAYADSSHGNGPNGSSFGGMVVLSAGGGALAWRGMAIKAGDDSPAATELRIIVKAYKCLLALRTLLKDLTCGMEQRGPTPIYTDSRAVELGAACEKVKNDSRWMATRYAMIRWGITCGTILLMAIASCDNPADIMTKCLPREAFLRHRAVLLGLAPPPEPPQVAVRPE